MRTAAVLVLLTLAACKLQPPPPDKPVGWDVYDRAGTRVLWMLDQGGTFETSAGPAPPGIPVYTHPAVTATAHAPKQEDHLRALLEATTSFAQYRAALEKDGYRVVPVGTKP